ncbi:major facilitator superfamily domain-containing protein [Mycotypha africana]|uniref:major facilitator superfamily domain-containing protein n=1 Tax=Mycotypha africana TaxID=64632 RepID=UPI002300A026|nr:major facilitator superfamily domain-containing protein [Mycotypha africana]KAI8971530.1 major facilitator superfamily domain-containing protein [Mycotypha africana]
MFDNTLQKRKQKEHAIGVEQEVAETTPLLHKHNDSSSSSSSTRSNHFNLSNPSLATFKAPSPWHILIPTFGLTFSFGALFAPMIQFYTMVFCYLYYQKQSVTVVKDGNSSDIDIPLEYCAIPEVQAIVSRAQAIIMMITYGSTLLFAGYYGSLSDRKGRKLILKISTFGNIVLVSSYILTIKFPEVFGISLLFIAPLLRGLLAGDAVMIAAAQAYISDCTTPGTRTIAFGRLMASVFIGATVGPTVASSLMKRTNSIASVFYLVLTLNIFFELYVMLILPESKSAEARRKSTELAEEKKKKASTYDSILQRINIFSALGMLTRAPSSPVASKYTHPYIMPIIAVIQFVIYMVALPPSLLYAMLQFGWTAYEGGLYISLAAFMRTLIMMLLLPFLSKLFHRNASSSIASGKLQGCAKGEGIVGGGATTTDVIPPEIPLAEEQQQSITCRMEASTSQPTYATTLNDDNDSHHKEEDKDEDDIKTDKRSEEDIKRTILFDAWMIRSGLTAETICYIVFGLVTTSAGFMATGALQSLSLLATPSIRSLTTTLVHPSEVGEMLGAMAVLEACAMMISNMLLNTIYSASVAAMPNLIFFVCAAIAGLGAVFGFFIYPTSTSPDLSNNNVSSAPATSSTTSA